MRLDGTRWKHKNENILTLMKKKKNLKELNWK